MGEDERDVGAALRSDDAEARSAAGRALGSIVTPRKIEHARELAAARAGQELGEDHKAKIAASKKAWWDEERKRRAAVTPPVETAPKRPPGRPSKPKPEASGETEPKKRGRPPKKQITGEITA